MLRKEEIYDTLNEFIRLKKNAEQNKEYFTYYQEQIDHISRLQKAYFKELRKVEERREIMNMPYCNDERSYKNTCFANKSGKCVCLEELFKDGVCKFYKTVAQAEASKKRARERLRRLGYEREMDKK